MIKACSIAAAVCSHSGAVPAVTWSVFRKAIAGGYAFL